MFRLFAVHTKHHLGKVEIHLEVMVVERPVLLGIEHFEQCGGRIATKIRGHLVDFVEKEQRIAYAALREVLDDLARHGTDVGPAMTADFRFVTHAAQ